MTIINMYAVVDEETDQVIGKKVVPFLPHKLQNLNYTLTLPDGTEVQGKAFLSKAVKYWHEVKDPLYLVSPGIEKLDLKLEGFI